MFTQQEKTETTVQDDPPTLPAGKHLIMIVDDLEPNRIILNDQILALGHVRGPQG